MTAISYREYAIDLHGRIQKLRRSKDSVASIEIAICRNAFCYKSAETIGSSWSRQFSSGPLNSKADLKPSDGAETSREIEAFFALPEIYAYSDRALNDDRSPLGRAHWDGTVALVEVRYDTALTTWHQRMLFIGFSDAIHADFTIGLDDDLFVNEQNKGTQLFEWQTDDPIRNTGAAEQLSSTSDKASTASAPTMSQRLADLVHGRWLGIRFLRPGAAKTTALANSETIGGSASGH